MSNFRKHSEQEEESRATADDHRRRARTFVRPVMGVGAMYDAFGLKNWEIVTISGIFAVCIVAFATVIGFTLAWLILRERSDVRHLVVATSDPRQPEFAVAAPSPA